MKKHSGYTLIELMVMMAVAAILLSVGVPQLSIFFQSNRMVSNTNDLVTALRLTRAEAIRRGSRVTICKSDNATVAAPACNSAANWEQGWIVFVQDSTGQGRGTVGVYDTANGGVLVRAHGPVDGKNVTITPQQADIDNYVSFTSRGTPKDANGNAQSGVFSICDSRGFKNSSGNVVARGVKLNAAGNVAATSDAADIVGCP